MAVHPRSASVRYQVEGALVRKIPAALTPQVRVARERRPAGVAEVDRLLEGGFPVGAISELTGPQCAGRTTLALAFVAGLIREGQVCAWVDATDGFDPESAEASGVAPERLLWVRCGPGQASPPIDPERSGSRYGIESGPMRATGCGGAHPRGEERGLSNAIGELLQAASGWRQRPPGNGKPGTPSAVNLPLNAATNSFQAPAQPLAQVPAQPPVPFSAQPVPRQRVEQVASDRQPARRGNLALARKGIGGDLAERANDFAVVAPRCAETQQGIARGKQARTLALEAVPASGPLAKPGKKKTYDRLDQAIRSADLLLQGGGFGCVVLDLSGVEAEYANRIPLATWFRFRMAADKARTSLLVLTRHPCTQSSAEVILRVTTGEPAPGTVLHALPIQVESAKQRFQGTPDNVVSIRKPPQPERHTGFAGQARSSAKLEWSAPTQAAQHQAARHQAGRHAGSCR